MPTTHIDTLLLRLPGVTAEEARAIAQDVAKELAQAPNSSTRVASFGALDLRIEIPMCTPRHRLAPAIAAAILTRLP
jgi:hypothetical protein